MPSQHLMPGKLKNSSISTLYEDRAFAITSAIIYYAAHFFPDYFHCKYENVKV